MASANWGKASVAGGGTGNLTLDVIAGFPALSDVTIPGTEYYYGIVNSDGTPIEIGAGTVSGNVLTRVSALEQMVSGVYSASPSGFADIPVGAIVVLPETKQLLASLESSLVVSDFGNTNLPTGDSLTFYQGVLRNNGGIIEVYPDGKVLDLGNVSGTVDLDMRNAIIRMNCTGNVTFTISNQPPAGYRGVTTLEITRTTLSGATLTWPVNVNFNSVILPSLADTLTTIVSIATSNGGSSYLGVTNAISYEMTATGLATTVNPSDASADYTLTDGNKSFQATTVYGTSLAGRSGRCFGGKTAGKWRLVARIDNLAAGDQSSRYAAVGIGIADGSLSNALYLGYTVNSVGFYQNSNTAVKTLNTMKSNVAGAVTGTPAAGSILGVLLDADTGKVWLTFNGSVVAGNPEAGTGESFVIDVATYFAAIGSYGFDNAPGAPTNGRMTLLNEVQDPYVNTWPSFQNWSV